MARIWLTLKFPKDENGDFSPKCKPCDGVILLPKDPGLLVPGTPYLEGSIITGPSCINEEIVYIVDYEDSLLVDPTRTLQQCDFRICCNDCSPKMIKLITDLFEDRIVEIEEIALAIPDPHTSVFKSHVELKGLTENSDQVSTPFLDPHDTYMADWVSAVYTFTNPSAYRSVNVKVTGKAIGAFINAHVSDAQNGVMEAFILVNGVSVGTFGTDYSKFTVFTGASTTDIQLHPSHVFTLAPSASVDLQAGWRAKRVGGLGDPAHLNSLRVDGRYVSLLDIIATTI